MNDPRYDPLPSDSAKHLDRFARDLAWGALNGKWRNAFYLQGIPAWRELKFSSSQNPDLKQYLTEVWNNQPPDPAHLEDFGYIEEVHDSSIGDDTSLFKLTEKGLRLVRSVSPDPAPFASTMPLQKLKVFVNYRRADEKIFVELLRTHFMFRYGQENVFMDFDSLPPFTNFEEYIRQTVRDCDVVAMMIGPRWTELMQEKADKGERDYVLIELEEALKHNKVIAPICIRGATMPSMPPSLEPIGKINAQFTSDGIHLLGDVQRIMNGFEAELEKRGAARSVNNPSSLQQMESTQPHSNADLDEMLDRFTDAATANDLPQALIWIAQLRASGQAIPAEFELDRREAELQARLHGEEDRRRRRDVADFQYKFVRRMIKLGDPAEKIKMAVEAIWQIEQGYVPDDLAAEIDQFMGGKAPAVPKLSIVVSTTAFSLPQLEWLTIPAGKVRLEHNKGTFDVLPFTIAKYPATNAQFQAFIDDGYQSDQWWNFSQAGRTWHKVNPKPETSRFPGQSLLDTYNLPRETVSWFEAMAFCRWLSNKLGQTVTLPTEMQWQRAAQGDDGREYPWGNDFDSAKCNTRESGIGQTTPIDRYPAGASLYGVMDMIGNVKEWCQNTFSDPQNSDLEGTSERTLRGGSWIDNKDSASATHRTLFNSGDRDYSNGFRVAANGHPSLLLGL